MTVNAENVTNEHSDAVSAIPGQILTTSNLCDPTPRRAQLAAQDLSANRTAACNYPDVVSQPMTPPRPVDVTAFVPELAELTQVTTRLHPRPGTPRDHKSSIGGPMLWPDGEPWPTCVTPWYSGNGATGWQPHGTPNPLVPVLQLFAADTPTVHFPVGSDLLQLLWCPALHRDLPGQRDAYAPAVTMIWRNSADLTAAYCVPPDQIDFEDELIPVPCTLHPEQVVEYRQELGEELWEKIRDLDERGWNGTSLQYRYDLSVAPGTKAGGWARWHALDPYPMPCADCGEQLNLLISFDTCERDDGAGSWDAIDAAERNLDLGNITGLTLGRGGDLQIFSCPANPRHQHHVLVQG
ncbi:hypothetical protein [Mycobacteroides chelonae]|uniref:hypothetical protein n=1 Tax=Mycobacteroides chelonae TaxID=1774 RepID=UPI001F3CB6E3|nr:hypothetical protein [Mycobacteroides chelonae]